MVQLVRKSNSISILLVIYLQIFTSPFHRYYQKCTECQAIYGDGRKPNHQSRQENKTKMVETIIVSDETDLQENINESNLTYCDRISKSNYNNRPLFCVNYDHCPTILTNSSEQVRHLTCGLRYDGAIKVCCSESVRSINSDMTSNNNFDTHIISDDGPTVETSSRKENSLHNLLARSNSSETLVVVDDQPLDKLGSEKEERQSKQRSDFEEAKQRLIFSKILAKFPKECGIAKGSENMDETRIIGGEAARKNAWPWFAILMVQRRNNGKRSPECGATLISDKYVLTAAHCILEMGKKPMKKERLTIRLGEFDLKKHNDGEVDFAVDRIIPHPYFQPKTFKNDIALLELDRKVMIILTILLKRVRALLTMIR